MPKDQSRGHCFGQPSKRSAITSTKHADHTSDTRNTYLVLRTRTLQERKGPGDNEDTLGSEGAEVELRNI
jgi:hypothetical protein